MENMLQSQSVPLPESLPGNMESSKRLSPTSPETFCEGFNLLRLSRTSNKRGSLTLVMSAR